MQKKYTLSYVYQILSESEFEFREDIIQFGNESWPLTRNMLWTTLTNLKKENKNTQYTDIFITIYSTYVLFCLSLR